MQLSVMKQNVKHKIKIKLIRHFRVTHFKSFSLLYMEFTMKLRRVPSRTRSTRAVSSNSNINNNNNCKTRKLARKKSQPKCRKCVCMPQNISPVEFPSVWTEFRINNQLCDGVVKCEDGKEFKIHRAILSAVSPYFKALFTNSINRGQSENFEAYIKAPSSILQKLLDFAYTGNCNVNNNNVEALLMCADQYEVLGVVQLCCHYILGIKKKHHIPKKTIITHP